MLSGSIDLTPHETKELLPVGLVASETHPLYGEVPLVLGPAMKHIEEAAMPEQSLGLPEPGSILTQHLPCEGDVLAQQPTLSGLL